MNGYFSKSWKRQIEGHDQTYVSPKAHLGIWQDRVTRSDRDPALKDSKRLDKLRRDCFGNRKRPVSREQAARGLIQRQTASDPAFAASWRALSPAEANQFVGIVAASL